MWFRVGCSTGEGAPSAIHGRCNVNTNPGMSEVEPKQPAQEGGAKVAEPPAKAENKTRPSPPKVENLPLFKVLLHNDEINTMEHVVRSLVILTPHDVRRAKAIMAEAHKTGLALVLVTHQERAELYQEQFQSLSLKVSIEPA